MRRTFRHKELGWKDIGEKFTRYALLKTRFGSVYLHQLNAPQWHPKCHDHPWSFVAVLLRRGYIEYANGRLVTHRPGSVLWRPAKFTHNVITRGTSWSMIFAGPKSRDWEFKEC